MSATNPNESTSSSLFSSEANGQIQQYVQDIPFSVWKQIAWTHDQVDLYNLWLNESLHSWLSNPNDCRIAIPWDHHEADAIQDALRPTVFHFTLLTNRDPEAYNINYSFFSAWVDLQAQLNEIWKDGGREDCPMLVMRGPWLGSILNWRMGKMFKRPDEGLEEEWAWLFWRDLI